MSDVAEKMKTRQFNKDYKIDFYANTNNWEKTPSQSLPLRRPSAPV